MAACEASEHDIQSSSLTLAGLISHIFLDCNHLRKAKQSESNLDGPRVLRVVIMVHLSVYMPASMLTACLGFSQ